MIRPSEAVRRLPGAGSLESWVRRRRQSRLEARMAGPQLLRAFASFYPKAVFVEIGANDGEQHDHLRPLILEHGWRGVMVEPVPYVFERLVRNYSSLPQVALENAAIAERNAAMPFYHLAAVDDHTQVGLPRWYDGIGSFSREAVLDHVRIIPDLENRLVETEVPCLTFDSLCRKHGLSFVDLLCVDTEGYDAEIIRSIDFQLYRPTMVVYEHYHLSESDREQCRALLHGLGYETMPEGFDTWCLHEEASSDLTRLLHSLSPAVAELSVQDEPR